MISTKPIRKSDAEKKSPTLQRKPDRRGPELDDSNEGLKSILSLTSPRTPPEAFASVLTRPEVAHRTNTSQRMAAINHLQRTYGNQYVQKVLQAKLNIGRPGDIYEKEADRVAEQVMSMQEPVAQRQPLEEEEEEQVQAKPIAEQITPLVQRQVEEEEKEEELQTKETASRPGGISSGLESRISAVRGGGQPLPPSTRAFFEPRFGYDFSSVRLHTDSRAAETAQAVKARAFTVGHNVVFGAGRYAPETREGKRLLAHELTHVVQQSSRGKADFFSNDLIRNVPYRKEMAEEFERNILPMSPVRGKGKPKHILAFFGSTITLQGLTHADFDGGSFRTEDVHTERGSGCDNRCSEGDCVHVTGTLVSTFRVTTTVTLPRVSDYPDLTPCQRERVQNAIDTVLAPHERQHVTAFETYNGTVHRSFDLTLCRNEFDSTIQAMHDSIESSRRNAAQAASDALDPFDVEVDLECED